MVSKEINLLFTELVYIASEHIGGGDEDLAAIMGSDISV